MRKTPKVRLVGHLQSIRKIGVFSPLAIFEHGLNSLFTLLFTSVLFSKMNLEEIGIFGLVSVYAATADTLIRQYVLLSSVFDPVLNSKLTPGFFTRVFKTRAPRAIIFFVILEIFLKWLVDGNINIPFLYIIFTFAALISSNLRYALIYTHNQRYGLKINFSLASLLLLLLLTGVIDLKGITADQLVTIWTCTLVVFGFLAVLKLLQIEIERKDSKSSLRHFPWTLGFEAVFFQVTTLLWTYAITELSTEKAGYVRLSILVFATIPQLLVISTSPRVNIHYANRELSGKRKFLLASFHAFLVIPLALVINLLLDSSRFFPSIDFAGVRQYTPGILFQTMSLIILASISNFTVKRIGITRYLYSRILSSIAIYGFGFLGLMSSSPLIFAYSTLIALAFTLLMTALAFKND